MPMDYLYIFAYHNIPEDWEEGKDGRKGCFAVYYKEWYVVDLEAVGEISNTGSSLICVCDYDYFVASIYEFLSGLSIAHFFGTDKRTDRR